MTRATYDVAAVDDGAVQRHADRPVLVAHARRPALQARRPHKGAATSTRPARHDHAPNRAVAQHAHGCSVARALDAAPDRPQARPNEGSADVHMQPRPCARLLGARTSQVAHVETSSGVAAPVPAHARHTSVRWKGTVTTRRCARSASVNDTVTSIGGAVARPNGRGHTSDGACTGTARARADAAQGAGGWGTTQANAGDAGAAGTDGTERDDVRVMGLVALGEAGGRTLRVGRGRRAPRGLGVLPAAVRRWGARVRSVREAGGRRLLAAA